MSLLILESKHRYNHMDQGVDEETADELAKEQSLSGVKNGTSLLKKRHGPKNLTETPKEAKAFLYLEDKDATELEVHVKAAGVLYKHALEANAELWIMERVKELIIDQLAKGCTLCPDMSIRLKELVEGIRMIKEEKDVDFPV